MVLVAHVQMGVAPRDECLVDDDPAIEQADLDAKQSIASSSSHKDTGWHNEGAFAQMSAMGPPPLSRRPSDAHSGYS